MGILQTPAASLEKMTKDQIIAAITAEADAERAAMRESRVVSQSGDARGQLEQTTETVNGNGKLIGRQQALWTYYEAGNVDTITITETDAAGKVIGKPQIIKHSTYGVN